MRTLALCLTICLLTGQAAPALTMDQAVEKALEFNPQIQQFVALENAAGARSDKARAPFWPSLEVGYSYWTGERDPVLDEDEASTVFSSARYNLFNGGSDWYSLQEANFLADAANYQRQSVVADTVLAVKGAFIEVLRAERNVETEEKSVELLERQRHESSLRLREGLIARNDLLRVAYERIHQRPGAYRDHVYGEFEAGGTSWLYLSPVPFEQAGFDTRVPRQPILHFVKDFLAVVPMVLTIWPGLFAGIYLLAKSKKISEHTHSQEDKRDETIEQ